MNLSPVATVVVCLGLCSCATVPPQPNYEYADGGLVLTSEPSGAKVEVTIHAIKQKNGGEIGQRGSNQVSFVTPHLDSNDKLIRRATLPDNTEILFKYAVKVSRGGFKPIVQEIDGRDIKSEWHWTLEPVDPKRLAASSNAPAAWVRLESCLLNGRPISENYPRYQEIRHYLADFVSALVETNLFVAASTERSELNSDRIVEFRLDFREKESRGNPAFGAGQAFLSGLLTLGAAPITGKYSYESEVSVHVARWDGKTRHYISKSKLSSRWLERPDGSQHAHRLREAGPPTRKQVTGENLRFLTGQAVQDANFHSGDTTH
jgi:hypothetical protein